MAVVFACVTADVSVPFFLLNALHGVLFSLLSILNFLRVNYNACCICSDPFGAVVVILFLGGIYININCAVTLGTWAGGVFSPDSPKR